MAAVHTSTVNPRDVYGVTLCVGPAVGLQQIRHEFAHALDVHRYGGYGSREEHERTRGGHDERFYDLLLQVLLRSPGDPRLYQWERDYPHLREWARRDGYYTPERKERVNVPVA